MTSQTISPLEMRTLGGGKRAIQIEFAGLQVTLDASGAAYIGAHSTLVVADLHLEKGSGAAARGRLLPALDSHDTLLRLGRAIETYAPQRVICLGDSFHDRRADERMAAADKDALSWLCASVPEWMWIWGNHDADLPASCGAGMHAEVKTGSVILRHEPQLRRAAAQIAGHLHPKISVPAGGYRFSGPCFCVWDELLIMPAFGAYAGGLSCSNPAIRSLQRPDPKLFMLHASKLWRVA